jgi:hypothetical protein
VILSSVRTRWPGFLKSQPRMNVALTRCRKGMVVVTDKSFLLAKGKKTLLGKLCRAWSNRHDACWIDWKVMLNNAAALPGLPLPSPSHLQNLGTTTPPSNPLSQTPTHQASLSTLAALASDSASVIRSGHRTTTTTARRDIARPLAIAPGQSSRRRNRKGRK